MKPVVFENFDVKTELSKNLNEIYEILSTTGLVLFKNQTLSVQDQEKILRENFHFNNDYEIAFQQEFFKDFLVEDSKILIRVTAQKNKNNKSGAFDDPNGLVWHTDNPTECTDRNLTWLYGYQGTVGSTTTYCNTNMAFNNMSHEMQEFVKTLKVKTISRFADSTPNEYILPLYANFGLGYGWLFPFEQIKEFVGYSKEESIILKDKILSEVYKDEFIYTHNWEDNDLVISNEKLCVHKRFPFNKMEERVMHKGTMGFKL